MSIVGELAAGAGCLKGYVCLAEAGLVAGVCCLLADGPLAVVHVGLETGIVCLADDFFRAAVAFGFLTLVLV